jgi:SAM-dependent methyltransferase
MELLDIVRRRPIPEPWAEGEKIPWHDPDFSQRMLEEHLSQEHDLASRRLAMIDRHVAWIHGMVLSARPVGILDLGCGPGLYTHRLARLGHTCLGIDFAPASIAYAREQAKGQGLACTYRQDDIRVADYGAGHGLAMLIFGEFNVFSPTDARQILEKAHAALADDSLLLLEPHTFAAVEAMGGQAWWYAAQSGLFAAGPHICLHESYWQAESRTTTERYFVVDALTGEVTQHAATLQAYTDGEYAALLASCGFGRVEFHASLSGDEEDAQPDFLAVVARKQKGR